MLEANPISPAENDNYWVRTIPAKDCGTENFVDFKALLNNTGIIRYKENNLDPTTTWDTTISTECSDEPYKSLIPMVPWKVEAPYNTQGM